MMLLGRDLEFDNKLEASIAQLNLTIIGCDFFDCSLNFPALKKSQIDNGFTIISPSVIIDIILSRLWLSRICLGVPFTHSSIPIMTLNLQSS